MSEISKKKKKEREKEKYFRCLKSNHPSKERILFLTCIDQ